MDFPPDGITASIKFHESKRTHAQNAAIHILFRQMSKELNEAGIEMKEVFDKMKEGVDIPWDKEGYCMKEVVWRRIQRSMTGKDSTTKLSKIEPSAIYEVMCRFFAERFGYQVPPFPTREMI